VVERTIALLRESRAEPVLVEKEIPGFIGNRLQYAILREALAIVRSGAASPEAVDTVMKASLGRRYATVGTPGNGGSWRAGHVSDHRFAPDARVDQR